MCEILINLRTRSDDKDWTPGMPIVVFEDGHVWGREERKAQWVLEGNSASTWPGQGKLFLLILPGVPAGKAQEFIAHQSEDDTGTPTISAAGLPVIFRKRRWALVIASVPAGVRATIASSGEYSTTIAAIRNYLKRVRDGAQYTGLD